MTAWDADKLWQWGMGLALPVTIGSACLDRSIIEAITTLFDERSPARIAFILSSTFLLVGFARNSARLRTILESQAETVSPASTSRREASRRPVFEPCND